MKGDNRMQLTDKDVTYLKSVISNYDAEISQLESELTDAASHGDLRENFQYEQVKGKLDAVVAKKQSMEALLMNAATPVLGSNIILGQTIKLTPLTDYAPYYDIDIKEDSFVMGGEVYPNRFVISNLPQVLDTIELLKAGFISALVPLVTQVLNKKPGEYDITFPNGTVRRYLYEVLED